MVFGVQEKFRGLRRGFLSKFVWGEERLAGGRFAGRFVLRGTQGGS